jgi:hypothetical protein
MTRRPLTPKERERVIELFLEGQSINHIVFLFHYELRIDDITEVIRAELQAFYTKETSEGA